MQAIRSKLLEEELGSRSVVLCLLEAVSAGHLGMVCQPPNDLLPIGKAKIATCAGSKHQPEPASSALLPHMHKRPTITLQDSPARVIDNRHVAAGLRGASRSRTHSRVLVKAYKSLS